MKHGIIEVKEEINCKHPPERIYAWWAYNYKTGKNDILCITCCVCGKILKGNAIEEEITE